MNKKRTFHLLILILLISTFSCSDPEVLNSSTSLIVKTSVVGYGQVENVIVILVERPSGNFVNSLSTNAEGVAEFENLQQGNYAVDCEYRVIDLGIEYITISEDFLINQGEEKTIEVVVD